VGVSKDNKDRLTALIRRLGSSCGLFRTTRAREPEFEIYDVTSPGEEADWATLDVVHWAPAWMTPAERLLLYALVFCLRPACYLEVGTLNGGSALIVAAAMDALHTAGRLVCVDPRPQIDPEHWKRLEQRTTLVRGFSPDVLPSAYEIAGRPFDFVFIDGDHTYAGVKRDANGVLPFVGDGAYLLFHDSFSPDIAQAARDFAAQHRRQVVDHGILTREFTASPQQQGPPTRWGGLRLMQIRCGAAARKTGWYR
jgi:predicted O-methyltransferase YrrM